MNNNPKSIQAFRAVLFALPIFYVLLTGCHSTSKSMTTEPIREIVVDLGDFAPDRTNLTSWLYAFSLSADGMGSGNRVQRYTSEQELMDDTKMKLAKMKPSIQGSSYVTSTIANRFSNKINWKTENLVVVYMTTGGPPFGTFGYSINGSTATFCMTPPNNPSGISGMALQTVVKCYATQKNIQIATCNNR